jgi:ribose transport system substrate-binding protein
MQVRKWAATASVVGMAVVVAACGSSSSSSSSSGSSGSSGSAKKNYKLTLIAGVKGDEFYITMNCGAKAEAQA